MIFLAFFLLPYLPIMALGFLAMISGAGYAEPNTEIVASYSGAALFLGYPALATVALSRRYPSVSPVNRRLTLASLACFGLLAVIHLVVVAQTSPMNPPPELYVVSFVTLALGCIVCILRAAARSILEAERTLGSSIFVFLLLSIFPIGVFYVQPRLRRLLSTPRRESP